MITRAALGDLAEGQVLGDVDLTRAEAAALNATGLVAVTPGEYGWRVTAAHTVGVVRAGELLVRVRPKVGVVQVLRLLARAHGLRALSLDQSLVDVDTDSDVGGVLAALFAEEARTALAAGALRGYRTEDQTLPVLRGRLRLRDQHLRRFGAPAPLEVTLDEWTSDIPENQLLRTAALRLQRLPDLPRGIRDRLSRVDRTLADVTVVRPGAPLPAATRTRLNARLHRLLDIAELVLRQSTVEHRSGEVTVHGYTLDMAWLFETLTTRLLAEHVAPLRLVAQATHPLDAVGRLTIKPDVELRDGRTVVAVADTKYKILDEGDHIPNPDAYQLIAYCTRLGLSEGHLIYARAGANAPDRYDIVGTGVAIHLHQIDLTAPLPAIEAAARSTVRHIAGHRAGPGRSPLEIPSAGELTRLSEH